jgi:hypothetical protein
VSQPVVAGVTLLRFGVVQQQESGSLIRQLQGCNLTRLEAGRGANPLINGSTQRASERLLGLTRLLLALDGKLMQCTQEALPLATLRHEV